MRNTRLALTGTAAACFALAAAWTAIAGEVGTAPISSVAPALSKSPGRLIYADYRDSYDDDDADDDGEQYTAPPRYAAPSPMVVPDGRGGYSQYFAPPAYYLPPTYGYDRRAIYRDAPPPPVYAPPLPYAPPAYGYVPERPSSCGQYRYWDGERCVDARRVPPYIGPKW